MHRWPWRAAFPVALCGMLVASAVLIPLWVMADSEQVGFTATLYSDVIRFEADGVAGLRVTIYDLAENELWDSGSISGDFIDWDRANTWDEQLANGYYLYLAQGWDSSGTLVLNKAGKVVLLPGDQVRLMAAPVVAPVMADSGVTAKPPNPGPPQNPARKPWTQSGNAGTTPGTNYLGTSDAADLVIRTNATEALRIDTIGRVGIGTPSPWSPLHVADATGQSVFEISITEEGHNDWAGLLIAGDGDEWTHSVLALSDNGSPWHSWNMNHLKGPGHALLWVYTSEDEPWVEAMVLTPDSRLGIGTNWPEYGFDLDVRGAGRFTGALTIGAYTLPSTDGALGQVLTTDGNGQVSWQTISGGGTGWSLGGNAGTSPPADYLGTSDAADLVIAANGTEAIRVNSAGDTTVAGDLQIDGDLTWNTRTGYVSVSAAAFIDCTPPTEYYNAGSHLIQGSGGTADFVAPVQLPHGATVTRVTLYYGNTAMAYVDSMRCCLCRLPIAGDAGMDEMASLQSSELGSYGSDSDTTIDFPDVDNSQYSYFFYLELPCFPLAQPFRGMIIEYEYAEPY